MAWISENWVWVLLGIGFIAMHLFGHGGHGGHGGHDDHGSVGEREEETSAGKVVKQATGKQGSGHQH